MMEPSPAALAVLLATSSLAAESHAPAATHAGMHSALANAAMDAEMPVSEKSICSWKKFPRFLVAVDRLASEWDRKRASLADAALRNREVTSPLRKMLMNDKPTRLVHRLSP